MKNPMDLGADTPRHFTGHLPNAPECVGGPLDGLTIKPPELAGVVPIMRTRPTALGYTRTLPYIVDRGPLLRTQLVGMDYLGCYRLNAGGDSYAWEWDHEGVYDPRPDR